MKTISERQKVPIFDPYPMVLKNTKVLYLCSVSYFAMKSLHSKSGSAIKVRVINLMAQLTSQAREIIFRADFIEWDLFIHGALYNHQ